MMAINKLKKLICEAATAVAAALAVATVKDMS